MGFVIFFIFFSIRLSRSNELGREFDELTQVNLTLFMESVFFLNRNFNLFSILSLNILFFFKLIFTIFSWFNFYWVIPLSWSRSQGFTILIFRSFLFVDFFLISYLCNWFVENKTLCFFPICFLLGYPAFITRVIDLSY